MKSARVMIATALVLGACMTGCSASANPAAPCWTSAASGSASANSASLVADCAVDAKDTYMVNLSNFINEQSGLRDMSRSQIVAALHDWRQAKGDDPRFLLNNPTAPGPIADYSQVRYIYVHGEHKTSALCEAVRGGVLVDFDNGAYRSAALVADLFTMPPTVAPVALSADTRSQLLGLVQTDVSAWPPLVGGVVPSTWVDAPGLSWEVIISAGDYSVHRFESPVSGKSPAGMEDFLLQFQTILGVSVLTPATAG